MFLWIIINQLQHPALQVPVASLSQFTVVASGQLFNGNGLRE